MTYLEDRWKIYKRLREIDHWLNSDIAPEIRQRYNEEEMALYVELIGLEMVRDAER